jgi:hypothetical protein
VPTFGHDSLDRRNVVPTFGHFRQFRPLMALKGGHEK